MQCDIGIIRMRYEIVCVCVLMRTKKEKKHNQKREFDELISGRRRRVGTKTRARTATEIARWQRVCMHKS